MLAQSPEPEAHDKVLDRPYVQQCTANCACPQFDIHLIEIFMPYVINIPQCTGLMGNNGQQTTCASTFDIH